MEEKRIEYRLPMLLIAAAFTLIALMVLVRIPGLAGESPSRVTVTEQNGVYDLSGIPDLEKTVVSLAPDSLYYPNVFLTPENEQSAVPQRLENQNARVDYLTQRFVLRLPDNSDVYDLNFTLSGRHALRVYVNGRLTGQAGVPGTTKQSTELWENNIVCTAAAQAGKMDIVLHVAQFYHARKGASLAALTLSKSGVQTDPALMGRSKGLMMMGALLSAPALLLVIYLLLSQTRVTLYFALACLAMALREFLQSQAWVYFPVNGNLSFELEYFSVVLLTIFLSLYLGQYASGRFLRGMQRTAILGSCVYGALVLFGDSILYTSLLKYYQILLVACIVPSVAVLFWKMRRPTKEQAAAMYGIAVFYLAAVSDILMYSDIFGNGPNVPVAEVAMLVFVLAQTVSLFLMNNRVLAESRAAEQRLAAEKSALESLNRMKTEFLGNVSHELKTPLTVMSGYAQTTRQLVQRPGGADGEEITRRMKLISSEAERLSLMVGQILDVTRMEEGRMAMEPVPCYVDEIIHAAIETHYPMLNKNANRLEIKISPSLPAVMADPARISQVIVNLISNAVRFTANGLITVSAKQEEQRIIVCVADTGCGISPERLPFLFERYHQKQKSGGGQDTGTGLGLYICKHIVEQHGGEIWLESVEGRGTAVFFSLPVPGGVLELTNKP